MHRTPAPPQYLGPSQIFQGDAVAESHNFRSVAKSLPSLIVTPPRWRWGSLRKPPDTSARTPPAPRNCPTRCSGSVYDSRQARRVEVGGPPVISEPVDLHK